MTFNSWCWCIVLRGNKFIYAAIHSVDVLLTVLIYDSSKNPCKLLGEMMSSHHDTTLTILCCTAVHKVWNSQAAFKLSILNV